MPKWCLPPRSAGCKQAEKAAGGARRAGPGDAGVQAQAQDLDRDYAVKKKNFDELLARREQARLAEAADTTADKIQFRIIDPPQVPVVPSAPNQPLLLSGVLVAAIGAAVALPFLLFQFDRSYTTVTGLRALGVPVLGSVSHLVFPDGQRRERIQLAAVCASIVGLLCVYGLLLAISANHVSIEHRLMESRTGLIERAAALLRESRPGDPGRPGGAHDGRNSTPLRAKRGPRSERRSRRCARASCSTAIISREPAS